MSYTYSKIASYIVSGTSTTTVVFLGIPQNYTDLKAVYSTRRSSAGVGGPGIIYLNSYTGISGDTSYTNKGIQGSGSSVSAYYSGVNVSIFYMGQITGDGATANTFSNGELYIPNYSNNKFKAISVDATGENNGTESLINLQAGLKRNTSPVTSIAFQVGSLSNYWMPHSSFTLYGIKAEV